MGILDRLKIFKRLQPRKGKSPEGDLSGLFRAKYEHFKELLDSNAELSKIIADLEEKLQGDQIFDMSYIRSQSARAVFYTLRMVKSLNNLSDQKYLALFNILENINSRIKEEIEKKEDRPMKEWVLPYSKITREMVNWVGGKSANLGEVLNRAGLPIPEGFAVSTKAFDFFLAANDLVDEINKKKMELDHNDPERIIQVSEEIQRLIISAKVPGELGEAILAAYDEMVERIRDRASSRPSVPISMRSSAIGEDSELSFAGQYLSMLNVPRESILQTYCYIVASLYTPRAMSYRLNKGILDEDVAMSVACLEMVESVASGVAYSRHPFNPAENNVLITAVWGLGPYAVDGVITPDSYTVAKDQNASVLQTTIASKPVQLVSNPQGGLIEIPAPSEKRDAPCLSTEQIKLLASHVAALEKHYGCPQDVEWALDAAGRILILQARPLKVETLEETCSGQTVPHPDQYPVLVENGAVAFPGIGFGKAFKIQSEEDLTNFPDNGVLIARQSSPKFVIVMPRAQAIVADTGSVTGHMASLCREFGIPTILDAKVAMSSIAAGAEVTVDAYSGKVYLGKVDELLQLRVCRPAHIKSTAIYQALKRVCSSITPLRLIDPKCPSFAPERCESLHDIMRFVHERSYTEMFRISDMVSEGSGCAISLAASIPLDLCVIDLGGGLEDVRPGVRKTNADHVSSVPFKALLKGMLHEDLRYHRPRPVELKGFFSVMGEQMLSPSHLGSERFGDRSYAIVSDKYLNFSSRVGYHYSVLDSYCGATASKNYITFSFKGGAADDVRRSRRARAISLILKANDFSVEAIADRVDARIQKYERPVIEEKLDMLGRLLLFTRQMDMLMHSEASVDAIANCFLEEDYHLERLAKKTADS